MSKLVNNETKPAIFQVGIGNVAGEYKPTFD